MKHIKVTCDICEKELELGKLNSKYFYFAISIGKDKQLQPIPKEEDYCAECSVKILEKLESIKKP